MLANFHRSPSATRRWRAVAAAGLTTLTIAVSATVIHHHSVAVLAATTKPATAQVVQLAPPAPTVKPRKKLLSNPLRGIATWYGAVLHGHTTASGEIFDETKMTACHNSLPFGTQVRVTDLNSKKSVIVRINDRGVLSAGRVIDLTSAAAERLGILRAGVAPVKVEVIDPKANNIETN